MFFSQKEKINLSTEKKSLFVDDFSTSIPGKLIARLSPDIILHLGSLDHALLCAQYLKHHNIGQMLYIQRLKTTLNHWIDPRYEVFRVDGKPDLKHYFMQQIYKKNLEDVITFLDEDHDIMAKVFRHKKIVPNIILMDTYYNFINPELFIQDPHHKQVIIEVLTQKDSLNNIKNHLVFSSAKKLEYISMKNHLILGHDLNHVSDLLLSNRAPLREEKEDIQTESDIKVSQDKEISAPPKVIQKEEKEEETQPSISQEVSEEKEKNDVPKVTKEKEVTIDEKEALPEAVPKDADVEETSQDIEEEDKRRKLTENVKRRRVKRIKRRVTRKNGAIDDDAQEASEQKTTDMKTELQETPPPLPTEEDQRNVINEATKSLLRQKLQEKINQK